MKVFVTGMGILSSLGNDVDSVFENLVAGKGATRAMPEWKAYNGLFSHLAAPAFPYDEKVIPRVARRSMSRMSEMGVLATSQALRQADLSVDGDTHRTMLLLGSTTGSPEAMESYFKKLFEKGGPEGQFSTSFFKVMNHSLASNVAVGLNYTGPLAAACSACSTSGQALALGWELLQTGLYDVVIAGGADELHYTSTAVFDIVNAASRGFNDRPELAPRPFDRDRDGLVVSEGAAVVVLETEAHAIRRGVTLLAELSAGAYICDGTHMSQPQADSMIATMKLALDRAGLSASEIDYVNAHATATLLGDIEEAKATRAICGEAVPVSSLKGHFGHSLAACGAVEAILSIEMIRRQTLIPTRNLIHPDERCLPLNLITQVESRAIRRVLSNNFAFGGMNASLVLSGA